MAEQKTSSTKTDSQAGTDNQDLIDQNKYFLHLLKHQKKYLLSLLTLIFLVHIINSTINNKPLLTGGESYYYLAKLSPLYNPLTNIISRAPDWLLFFLPFVIVFLSIILWLWLAKKLLLQEKVVFFFVLFLILSPAFIFSFISLSGYSFFIFLTLLGFTLLMQESKTAQALSLAPFIAATFFDTYSAILLLVLLTGYYFSSKTSKISSKTSPKKSVHNGSVAGKRTAKGKMLLPLIISCTIALAIFNCFFLKIPFIEGPFHVQKTIPDLVSDMGGLSGVSLFLIILAIIGLLLFWKRKNIFAYIMLLAVIPPYFFNTNTIIFFSIMVAFFAAAGFVKLFENKWTIISLKNITFFLLFLGIIFSAVAYLDRTAEYSPLSNDQEALTWVKENTPENLVVLSDSEYSYYIKYFSAREPIHYLNSKDYKENLNLTNSIFSSLYIQELFPLLEENNVSIIYVTETMKKTLPKEQGFLFLLKNERFKLIHSSGSAEVWTFEKEPESKSAGELAKSE
ncbi:MAG: hypothetical protein AB1668_01965 [Nanoarchaeota archaeon]